MNRKGPKLGVILAIVLLFLFFLFRRQTLHHTPGTGTFRRSYKQMVFTKHARCRMECRHIDESEVREILEKGRLNDEKSEPAARPDPKFALEGITHDNQRVRIIFASSGEKVIVITVIDLDGEWKCNC